MKYLLVREDEDGAERLWGRCAGVEGLFVDPVPPPREVLTLRGWSERDRARLLVLDRHGAVMASLAVGPAVTGARPSRLGGTLVDITLADGGAGSGTPSRTAWAAGSEWSRPSP
ncbi:hypothetical protein AB0D10_40220 [Kitasatospora sp. NPDC048545]|uniref:hypothetical protein n=1 Tax=Kitasatospora sp. NPDC048545 TaxID=3157208 RepID=UPI0033D02844